VGGLHCVRRVTGGPPPRVLSCTIFVLHLEAETRSLRGASGRPE
jgi:hypothetical protein